MLRCIFIHGFNVYDGGAGTVDMVALLLKQRNPDTVEIDTDNADYGWHFLIRVHLWILRRRAVKRIRKALDGVDVVVTHSNGANYFMKAVKKLCKPKMKVFHLSPALNRGRKFRECDGKNHVFFTHHDKAVKWARWIPFSSWGDMGRHGATDKSVVNYNFTKTVFGHSHWFIELRLLDVVRRIEHETGLQYHEDLE